MWVQCGGLIKVHGWSSASKIPTGSLQHVATWPPAQEQPKSRRFMWHMSLGKSVSFENKLWEKLVLVYQQHVGRDSHTTIKVRNLPRIPVLCCSVENWQFKVPLCVRKLQWTALNAFGKGQLWGGFDLICIQLIKKKKKMYIFFSFFRENFWDRSYMFTQLGPYTWANPISFTKNNT